MREHGHSLDDEALRTLMCEAEAVVNNRRTPNGGHLG